MNHRIPEETIQQIQSQVNIVDLVSQYVSLKKRGKNFFGHCPFHEERTPSFSVTEEKQIFHCFSCGRGGNVFSFISEMEGLTFVESVVKVADFAHIPLDVAFTQNEKTRPSKHQALFQVHQKAQQLYHHTLLRTRGGQLALDYLTRRGLTTDTLETFGLGFSLQDRTYLVKLVEELNLTNAQKEASGLFVVRKEDVIDRFFNRMMIPLRNPSGQVVGFSGRMLPTDQSADEPKYLNSPETPIFNKRSFLFNLDLARSKIRKSGQVVVFEGYMDVIAAWQAGVKNGVASMGTSLTQEQVALLTRMANEVVIAYDGDRAGLEATNRAIELLQQHSTLKIAILPMEEGIDPDEFIQKNGSAAFQDHLAHFTETVFQFKKRFLKKQYRTEVEREKIQYLEKMILELATITNPVERELALQALAKEYQLAPEVLAGQVKEQQRQSFTFKPKRSATTGSEPAVLEDSAEITVQKHLLYRLFHSPQAWKYLAHKQPDFAFLDATFQQLFLLMKEYREQVSEEWTVQQFLNTLTQTDVVNRNLVTAIEWLNFPTECTEKEIHDLVDRLEKIAAKKQYQNMLQQMKEAQLMGNTTLAMQLTLELAQIQKNLKPK